MRWIAMRAFVPHHQDVQLRQWKGRWQDQKVQIRGEVRDDALRDRRDEVGFGDDLRRHGEIRNAHADLPVEPQRAKFLVDGRFDTARARSLARCGYQDYATVEEVFAMARPKGAGDV